MRTKPSTSLKGEYLIFIEDREIRCPVGAFVFIPRGVVHGFRVGSETSAKLNIYVPGAMVGYFDELAASLATGTGDEARLQSIAERFDMEVLGPVPEAYV